MTLRALIVDDEPIARRRVRRLLREEQDVEVVGECGDGRAALADIASLRPDLVFLDVQMPGEDGLAVVARLDTAAPPAIVFVTAFDRYALQAFDAQALDYLLKPFTHERFRVALDRARRRIAARSSQSALLALIEQLRMHPRYLQRLPVRSSGRIALIDLDTVDWLEASDNYVTLHVGAHEYLMRETLSGLESQLDPYRFVRIHRSAIVRIDRIVDMHRLSHGDFDLRLHDGTALTLSRTWRDRIERALGRPL